MSQRRRCRTLRRRRQKPRTPAPDSVAQAAAANAQDNPHADLLTPEDELVQLRPALAAARHACCEQDGELQRMREAANEGDAYAKSIQAALTAQKQYADALAALVAQRDQEITRMRATMRWRLGERLRPVLRLPKALLRSLRSRYAIIPLNAPAPNANDPSPEPNRTPNQETPPAPAYPQAARYDVLCLAIIDWDFRFQRPQQLASAFAKQGHRVFWVSPTRFAPPSNDMPLPVQPLQHNIWEVHASVVTTPNPYEDRLCGPQLEAIISSIDRLRRNAQMSNVVCLVQIPFWSPVATELRTRFGWRVVYDCMDEWDSFPGIGKAIIAQERELARASDVLAVTAQRLRDKWQAENCRCVLVRNGADFEHFQTSWPVSVLDDIPHPIIGYFGAIAPWFDVQLVAYAARAHPEWQFVLVGGVYDTDVSPLQSLANVHLVGNQPYAAIPAYLRQFDVCTIPFKINKITEATDPVKLYEYLSQGKPVVSVALPELHDYRDHIYIASDPADFVDKLAAALAEDDPCLTQQRMALARAHTWTDRYQRLHNAIVEIYPTISIVMVTYNNRQITEQCLQSIFAHTAYPAYDVIIVDNASHDGTPEMLRRVQAEHSNVRVILNQQNLGFACANNQAIRQSSAAIIVFLNNDTVVTPDWLDRLARHLDDPQIGLVGAITNHAGNEARIEATYTDLSHLNDFSVAYTWAHDGEVFDIRVAPLFCAAMRRADWQSLGGLNEQYEIGMFEDDDLAERVRRILKLRVVCAEDVYVHHIGQASFALLSKAEYNRLFEQNRRHFEQTWQVTWTPHRPRPGVAPAISKIK